MATSAKPRNEVWDALVEVLGFEPRTTTEKRKWGKVVKSLRSAGATAEQIRDAAKAYRKEWPTMTLTETALEVHFSRFAARADVGRRARAAICPSCGIGGGLHLTDCEQVGG